MSKNNMRSPFIDKKHHVKLYKRGKSWVAMGITMATLTGVSFVITTNANAAEKTINDPASTISQTNSAEQPANTDSQNGTTTLSSDNTGNQSTGTPVADQNVDQPAQPNAGTLAVDTGNQPVPQAAPVTAPTPAPVPKPETSTHSVGPTVTTTDKSGAASTDPHNTGSSNDTPTEVSGEDVAKNFVAGGSNGTTVPQINGNTADLTNPTDPTYVQNGAIVAKDAVDFNTDFSLNATVNVKWDSTMGSWLGGDGMAVAFQPISTNDALTKGSNGSSMGLVTSAEGTISYIISTDAVGYSPHTVDGNSFPQATNWVIYQSGANSSQATGGVYDTGIVLPKKSSSGSLNYTFDVAYKADTKQLVTNIVDGNNRIVKTYSQKINDSQIGNNFVLGVTAATMSSKAAYSVTINKYTYVPADAKLNITSNMPNVAQSGINGTPGQVIAFYQEGTTKPTTNNKGNAVSAAYTVPAVKGYTLSPQFITLTAGGENTIALNYVGNPVTAAVTIPSNLGYQIVNNIRGHVGDVLHIAVPTIAGYTPDKNQVTATVQADGNITVNSPSAKTGDAGYVTYSMNEQGATQTMIVKVGDKTWTTTGLSGSNITYDAKAILALIPDNYTINTDNGSTTIEQLLNSAPKQFDSDTTKDQSWTLNVSPAEDFSHTTTTRTIHFVDSTGKTVSPDVVQTVNWIRTNDATTDPENSAYSPMDWYTSVPAPTIAGYTPNTSNIAEDYPMITDAPTNADDITVTYTADTQTMVVKVGDKTWTTTGPSDSAISYDADAIIALIPKGYTVSGYASTKDFANALKQGGLVNALVGGSAPTTFDHDTAKDQTWTLPISPAESLNHTTTTRTIHFVDENGQTVSPDVVQTVNWVQTVNAATGEPTDAYRPIDWYTSAPIPTIDGYTADTTNIAEDYPMITDAPANAKDITVTYETDTQTMIVKVGNKTWTTTGKSNTDINYDTQAILALIPDGYSIGSNQSATTIEDALKSAPAKFDKDSKHDQTWTLEISPAESFNHTTTTRTIHFVDSTGKTVSPDVVQTVNWVQTVNATTGEPTNAYAPVDWYTSVTVPTVAGYKTETTDIAEDYPMITDNPENANDITITYSAETQTMIVKVGDKTWTTTGASNSKIDYDTNAILALIPNGYSITSNTVGTTIEQILSSAPKQFDTDTAKDQTWTLPISPAESFNHTTTTRTIHFVDKNGKTVSPDVVQTVNWVQTVNAATGKPTNAYTPIDWYTAMTAPTITGYTPDQTSVAAEYPMITDAPTNATDITIVYTGNQVTVDVTIPSNQGPQTATNVTGKVGETVTVPVPTIDGYTADKSMVSATVNPDGTITINGPKAKPGDAGYVTYTANSTNGGNTIQPGDTSNPTNTDNQSPTIDESTQPGTVPTQTPTITETETETATNQNVTATKPEASQGISQSAGHSTGVTKTNTPVAGSTTAVTSTQLSHSVATSGETTTGQQKGQSATGQLPQTNEQSEQARTAGVLGLMILSLLSLFGLKRKQTDDK